MMRDMCIKLEDGQHVSHYNTGHYVAMAILSEIAHAMRVFRAGGDMDSRQEDAWTIEGEPGKLCVRYNEETQQFTWVRTNLSALDTEIMCMVEMAMIQQEILGNEESKDH